MGEKREETEAEKWKGKATASLKGLQSHQIWPLLSDFYNVHKWLPYVDTCYPVDADGALDVQPGIIRCCTSTRLSTAPSATDAGDKATEEEEEEVKYAKERLISIDHQDKWLTYDIVENNAGFSSYVATLRLIDGGDEGCVIEWSYVADPVVGWRSEDLLSLIELGLHSMAAKMEEFLGQPTPN